MDIDKLREETPGVQHKVHLNNAGSALPPQAVTSAMQQYIEYESLTGGYEAYADREDEINRFYGSGAKLLSCEPTNIAFAGSATDAFIKALSAIAFQRGDVILTSLNDYTSNQIQFLALVKKVGARVIHIPDLPEGGVDPQATKDYISRYQPKLVSITHIPTNSGLVQDIYAIGDLCRDSSAIYIVDACQSLGQMPVDPVRTGCQFMSATMRKFLRGPRGAGFLYVSDDALKMGLEPQFIEMRGAEWTSTHEYRAMPDARRFEEWERNYAVMLGSTAAIDYATAIGLDQIMTRTFGLADYARTELSKLNAVDIVDEGNVLSGIVTIYIDGADGDELHDFLALHQINTAVARLSGNRFDFGERKQIPWALRVSPHYYNTREEIAMCVSRISEFCDALTGQKS